MNNGWAITHNTSSRHLCLTFSSIEISAGKLHLPEDRNLRGPSIGTSRSKTDEASPTCLS